MVTGGAGCSGEKWKGIKLIHQGGESHSRGWRAPPRRLGQEQEVAAAAPKGPDTQSSGRAQEPARTLSHHGRQVVRGDFGLTATWDHLGLLPSRTSGVAGSTGEGRAWRGGRPRQVCSLIRRRGQRGGSPPAPKEQRSAGRAGPIAEALVAVATAASGAAAPRRPRCKVTQQAKSARAVARAGNLEICC